MVGELIYRTDWEDVVPDWLELPLNFSRIKHIGESLLKFKDECITPWTGSADSRKGSATHCLFLEPEEFQKRFAVYYSHRNSKKWEEFKLANAGKIILNVKERAEAGKMARALVAHQGACDLLKPPTGAILEERIYWIDPSTGFPMAGTPDSYALVKILTDLKTTNDISDYKWRRKVLDMDYHAQLALYSDGLLECGKDVESVFAVAVCSSAPYDVRADRIPDVYIDKGRERYQGWLQTLAHAIETDKWPGAYPGIGELEVPYSWRDEAVSTIDWSGVSDE